jgi:hypothetical protein
VGSQVWVNPWYWCDHSDFTWYREQIVTPRNPVKETLGMSGECLCVKGNTLIMAEDGWRRIQDIEPGDPIYNLRGGQLVLTPVATVHRNRARQMLAIKPTFVRPLTITGNHPLYVRTFRYQQKQRNLAARIGPPEYAAAADVATRWRANKEISPLSREMHLIGMPFRTAEISLGLSDEQLRLIGHFAAEGAYNWRKDKYRDCAGGIIFTLSAKKSREHTEDIRHCIETGLGLPTHWRDWIDKRNGRQFLTVRNCSVASSNFIKQYFTGRYAGQKAFRDLILTATLREQSIILAAMWRGDGSNFALIAKHVDVSTYTTTSIGLALQVQEMLLRKGAVYGLHYSKNPTKFGVSECYQVRKETNDDKRHAGKKFPSIAFIEDGVFWAPIKKVSDAGRHATFNLTIAGEPNYRTASGLVHNCGAYSEPGELERVGWACPETKAYLEDLQVRVRAAGFPWGWEDPGPPKGWKCSRVGSDGIYVPDAGSDYRPMCFNCDKVHLLRVTDGSEKQETLFE